MDTPDLEKKPGYNFFLYSKIGGISSFNLNYIPHYTKSHHPIFSNSYLDILKYSFRG